MPEWPADRPERRALSTLRPFPRNARTHSPEQIEQVANSIKEWGWTFPVLIDASGEIIAGHARVLAAQRLGLAEVPCIVATSWSDTQKRAYIIADNKLALNAGWDEGLLALEVGDLKGLGFDLGLTGFQPGEVDELFARANLRAGKTDPDQVGELPSVAYSAIGDVWLCGDHRLACGDCTLMDIVGRAKGELAPILMVTDPPYGVNYDPSWRKAAGLISSKFASGKVQNDDRADWREAWRLFGGDVAYVWHGGLHAAVVEESLIAADFEIRSQIVWVKHKLVIGRSNYHWQHEPCWYAVRKGARGNWQGDRKQSTTWQIAHVSHNSPNEEERTIHGTQKPAEAMLRPILNNSRAGQVVYEPFMGSGTTMIACQMSGRRCVGIELNPLYVDLSVRRWQEFTGETARRERDGKTLVELEQESKPDEARNETDTAGAAGAARQSAQDRDAHRRARGHGRSLAAS